VQVPAVVIVAPDTLTVPAVLSERNAEVRRVMVERVGWTRILAEAGWRPTHEDETGTLYRVDLPGDEPLVLVHVTNATPEADGSRRRYILRVPPTMQRAREAVAWTFDQPESAYQPTAES